MLIQHQCPCGCGRRTDSDRGSNIINVGAVFWLFPSSPSTDTHRWLRPCRPRPRSNLEATALATARRNPLHIECSEDSSHKDQDKPPRAYPADSPAPRNPRRRFFLFLFVKQILRRRGHPHCAAMSLALRNSPSYTPNPQATGAPSGAVVRASALADRYSHKGIAEIEKNRAHINKETTTRRRALSRSTTVPWAKWLWDVFLVDGASWGDAPIQKVKKKKEWTIQQPTCRHPGPGAVLSPSQYRITSIRRRAPSCCLSLSAARPAHV